jgi:hypothetical protein
MQGNATMPVTTREAIRILDVMIEKAHGEADSSWSKRFGKSWLQVEVVSGGAIEYTWGKNKVPRHIALNVVATYTESSR